ncbi:MAG: PD-(D/E)XK nuclease family protein [Desulfobacterales bacterium]
MNCSLKYFFRYVLGKPAERMSIALPVGKAVHAGIEHCYREYLSKREKPDADVICKLFADFLTAMLDKSEAPVVFGDDENKDSIIETGKAMMTAFCKAVKPENVNVKAVELPFSAKLYTETAHRVEPYRCHRRSH